MADTQRAIWRMLLLSNKNHLRLVRQVCEALGLDWSKLPGPEGRV